MKESWSDERLGDAYRALVGVPAPYLADAVIAAIREDAARPRPRRASGVTRRLRIGIAGAAAALIAIVVGVALVLPPPIGRLGGPAPRATSPARSQAATPPGSAAATSTSPATPVNGSASETRSLSLTRINGHPIRFEIVDPAHRVLDARQATSGELDAAAAVMSSSATIIRAPSGSGFVVAWIGTVCDGTVRLTVEPAASSWRLVVGPRMACDAVAEGHGVVVRTADAAPPTLAFTDATLVPERVAGLAVISVADAVAHRDTKLDDTELAVFGYRNDVVAIPCPYPGARVSPVQPRCPDDFAWLMEDPEQLVTAVRGGTTTSAPNGPAVNPLLRLGVPTAAAARVTVGPERPRPVATVLVGHFDDYRAALCPKAEADVCRKQFVVDAEAWIDGIAIPAAQAPELERWNPTKGASEPVATIFTPESAPAVLQLAGHHPVTRWVVAVSGADVESIDPRAKGSELAAADVVWVIRELEDVAGRPVVVTYFVGDGSETSYFKSNASGISAYGIIVGTPPD